MPNPSVVTDPDLLDTEVQELFDRVPSALIRYGIGAMCLTLLALFALAAFIRYPEVVEAQGIVSIVPVPHRVVARQAGNVVLLVKEGEQISVNQVLGYVKSSVAWEVVREVEIHLTRSDGRPIPSPKERGVKKSFSSGEGFRLGQGIPNLGVLQPPFESYQKSLADLSQFYQSNLQAQQVANFQMQMAHYQLLNENLQKQNRLLDKELLLTEKRYKADSSLSKNKALAPLEADRTEESLLQKKRGLQSAEASIISNNLRIAELENRIGELKITYQDKEKQLLTTRALLKSKISKWKENYLWVSSITGKVSFATYLSDYQNVSANQEILTIVPEKQAVMCKAAITAQNAGKVQIGQVVHLHLANYPSEQFGWVEGKISQIALAPKMDEQGQLQYAVHIHLPKTLTTHYRKNIPLTTAEMQASLKIITEELSLLERLFFDVRKLLKN